MRRALVALVLSVALIGAGAAPAGASFGVYPYGLSFGPQAIGTASAPQALSVHVSPQSGSFPSFSGFQIAYPDSLCAPLCAAPVPQPDFVGTTDCPIGATSASCHIYVTFRPLYPPAGPRAATLWVNGGNNGYYHAPLSGTAAAPTKKKCKKHKPRSAQTAKKRCKKKR
jgi:hypothetical protein